jgi:hypothetical protein
MGCRGQVMRLAPSHDADRAAEGRFRSRRIVEQRGQPHDDGVGALRVGNALGQLHDAQHMVEVVGGIAGRVQLPAPPPPSKFCLLRALHHPVAPSTPTQSQQSTNLTQSRQERKEQLLCLRVFA